jgi:hypothetical protein
MAAISTPTTAKNAILSLCIVHLSFSELIVKREEVELRPEQFETPHALLMISPAPGIRRPSYNGAPAMPTPDHFQTTKVIILRVPLRLSLILNDFLPLKVS